MDIQTPAAPIVKEVLLNAPITRVWKAITDKNLCEVKEVIVNQKISYTWMYEGQNIETLVSFELFPEGEQTRLKLTHTGVEKLPQDRDFAKSNFEHGWTEIIQKSLKEYVQK